MIMHVDSIIYVFMQPELQSLANMLYLNINILLPG